jgi:HTH-type transcriptional regulator/antitoxin HigA
MDAKEYNIKNQRLEEILKMLSTEGHLSNDLSDELDFLSEEIADYEDENYPFKADTLKEMIELRMFQRKLKQKDVAQILGTTPSRISEILNGKRNLTIELARGLHQKLNIDAELILSA